MFLLHSSRSFEYICFSKCSSNRYVGHWDLLGQICNCFLICASNFVKNKNTNTNSSLLNVQVSFECKKIFLLMTIPTEADDHPKIYRIKLWPANKLYLRRIPLN
ncbi:hypothetical protein ACOSP7_013478 [Xanthoceras sorbifolium]